ncbi:MAG: Crp/Fnr family transcriptional regulator [Deltaproteobacteria bacterium]|nr:Crp/Fnr family transcriptional regulator [Deltaproteobacteria bacterium]
MRTENIEMLRKVGFLAPLENEQLQRLAALLVEKYFRRDSIVVKADDPGDSMYFIALGQAKVVLAGGGREVILATLRAGDFFGEMSLLDGRLRSATVIAIEDSRMLVLQRNSLLELVRSTPEIALALLAEMSARLRRADEAIANLALVDVYGRVARYLIDQAKREGRPVAEGILIRSRPTQQHIASTIGTSRETVSRALSDFKRRGLVLTRGRDIIVQPSLYQEVAPGSTP